LYLSFNPALIGLIHQAEPYSGITNNSEHEMKISYNWLKQYLSTDLTPEEMAEVLTSTGLEVEGMEPFEPVKGGLEGVVIGEVISCEGHPNADKLKVTRVNTGNGNILQIVCGAPNVATGQKVAVALAGATLYAGEKSIVIKETRIRGELSEGMICAEDELGLGDSHDGIMVLNSDAVPGSPASSYFNIDNDTVFEIGLTPNRIDAASHFGVARDLSAWAGQNGEESGLTRPDVGNFSPDNNDYPVDIIIEDKKSCTRYSGVTISGVTIAPSPAWLQSRLRAIGLKPINNVVDITNYVLHETGQPLHAFNAEKIKGRKVVIGPLPDGTDFVTLDGQVRRLSGEDLMICNAEEGMCIAGVFGGISSGVTEGSTHVFLESACFDPVSVRKTARRHGLATDASFRFERGTDPSITVYALKRAALLIKEIAGGTISSDVIDVYPVPATPVKLEFGFGYARRLVGEEVPVDRMIRILSLLDFKIEKRSENGLMLEVPLYRVDVTRPADVVEEILRIYGYNTVSVPDSVHSTISYSQKPDKEKYTHSVADMLSSLGFNEIISNSLTKSSYYKNSRSFPEENLVELLNPLSNDLDCLRQDLVFGGLEAVAYNSNRKNPDLKLYELGNIYRYNGGKGGENDLNNYHESIHLALFITGLTGKTLWNRQAKPYEFHDIKAYTHHVIKHTGIDPDQLTQEETGNELFIYGLRLTSGDEIIAEYGLVNREIAEKAEIKNDLFYADIFWDNLLALASKKSTVFSELPRFPEVRRDLALELDTDVKFSTIKEIIYNTEKTLLKSINLFDVYQGDKIAEGKKSYAISFILQSNEGTLTDSRIDAVMNMIASALEDKAGARIRR
jgi:phenylalanyl-tRNA synthetase beta chain